MQSTSLLSIETLKQDIHAALKAWQSGHNTPENLLESLLLVQIQRQKREQASDHASLLRLATNEVLLEGINKLAKQDEMAANILQMRFPDNNPLLMAANKFNVSEHTVSRMQREAIEQLTRIIAHEEEQIRIRHINEIESKLPPSSYEQLFGLTDLQTKLLAMFRQAASPWVVAIIGIGGIGKTALADSITRQIIREFLFADVIWLRVEYQSLSGRSTSPNATYEYIVGDLARHFWPEAAPDISNFIQLQARVRQQLKTRPYLVIIDNLETQPDISFLQAYLNDLAQPTKFLVTSRARPTESTQVYALTVDELSEADSASLMRQHATEIGLEAFAQATEDDVANIYSVTGGNPLAIKLVISLLDMQPLPEILSNLQKGQSGASANLYKYLLANLAHP
ncbi:MAG: NB-ARC domain-containing protein [Chloroflexota bacterium]